MAPRTEKHENFVYKTDRWDNITWRARKDAPCVKEAIGKLSASRMKRATDKDYDAGHPTDIEHESERFAHEVYARLVNEPEKLEEALSKWMERVHELLDDSPEMRNLQHQLGSDLDMAALATSEILEEASKAIARIEEEEKNGEVEIPGGGAVTPEGLLQSAVRRGLRKAAEEVQDAREALNGLLPGLGSSEQVKDEEGASRLALAQRLKGNKSLREILRLAGRLLRSARARKARTGGQGARIKGVTRGSDLARVLPSELAGLQVPGLETLTMQRVISGEALQYETEGPTHAERGPVCVIVDESGSMYGEPNNMARALVLATLQECIRDRRPCRVVGFSTRINSVHTYNPSGAAQCYRGTGREARDVQLPAMLMELASVQGSGGTRFDPPLREALRWLGGEPLADFLFITDGRAEASAGQMAELELMKGSHGLRVFGVLVGAGASMTGAVETICDTRVKMNGSTVEEVSRAVA